MDRLNFIEFIKISQYITIKLEAKQNNDLGTAAQICVNNKKVYSFYLRERRLNDFCDLITRWIKLKYKMKIIPFEYEDMMFTVLSHLNDIKVPKAMKAYRREIDKKLIKEQKGFEFSNLKDNILYLLVFVLLFISLWIFFFYTLPILI
jgi:hypothetical protein